MDSTTPSPERIELTILRRDSADPKSGNLTHYHVSDPEVAKLIEEIQKEVEAEQKKADATSADM